MNEKEALVLSILEKLAENPFDSKLAIDLTVDFNGLRKIPLTQLTPEFLYHPTFVGFIKNKSGDNAIQFWYLLAIYFLQRSNEALQHEQLLKIDQFCSTVIQTFHQENFSLWTQEELANSGCRLQPDFLSNPFLIKNIYASMDEPLIALVKKYASIPRAEVFSGTIVPDMIAQAQAAASQSIKQLLEKHDQDLQKIEHHTIRIQRGFRRKRRYLEEEHRVNHVYQAFFKQTEEEKGQHLTSQQLIHEANQPYIPKKCHKTLASRILSLTQKIELYTTIRHLTSSYALKSIFNDALYGRRSLQQFFIPFKPAALMRCDIENGDGNVICFAPNKIDPKAGGNIEIVLDLKTVIADHPAAFYKESDLAYDDDNIREVKLKDKLFLFMPIKPLSDGSPEMLPFRVLGETWGELLYYSHIPKNALIAYDLKNMSQILILNFFRFIDELRCCNGEPATEYIAQFYNTLEQMDDSELEAFLRDAGLKLTQTAEFNFYGAYRLDFSSIITIRLIDKYSPGNLKQEYTLNLKGLNDSLAVGDLTVLESAKKSIPSLFTSYRFLDYLLSNTQHALSKRALEALRKTCDIPPWVDNRHDQPLIEEDILTGPPKI
jgi:hypothetical protein